MCGTTQTFLPRAYAYGRCRLRRDTSAHQVFIVLDYIDGQPLTKKEIGDSSECCRRQFSREAIDLFSQLQRLKFPRGGSLIPHETVRAWLRLRKFIFPQEEYLAPQSAIDLKLGPRIAGAFSMRKNELQVDGYAAPRYRCHCEGVLGGVI